MNFDILIKKIWKMFPLALAKQNNDFVGLMAGRKPREVHKILLSLDLDELLIPDILSFRPDVIFTHHPFIYGKRKLVLASDPKKKELFDFLIKENIPVYSFHTNFDMGKGGMNDTLCKALGLNNVYSLKDEGFMRIGYLEKSMPILEFCKYAKEKLNVDYGLLIHEGKENIQKVGIIGGGGSGYYPFAKRENVDIYISGDVPHHVRRGMVVDKMNYLDLPHEIEKIFMPRMKEILLDIDKNLEILALDHEKPPKVV